MRIKFYPVAFIIAIFFFAACSKENNYSEPRVVLKESIITLSTSRTNYFTFGINSSSTLQIRIFDDSSFTYDAVSADLGDQITGATINYGDPVSEGRIMIDLKPRISGQHITGAIFGMSAGLLDSLVNDNIPKYFNITTSRLTNGLVRGQLNENITF
ncbi:MAG TPA: CHRD domain-containing protein, partial [Segetibacter sp.]